MEEFEEFDDVLLEAVYAEEEEEIEQPNLNRGRPNTTHGHGSSNQEAEEVAGNQSNRTQKKKRIPRPKSTYTLAKATEEQATLLHETVQEINDDEFVRETSFQKSRATKTYAEECLKQLGAGAGQILLQFTTILMLVWAAVHKADSFSTGPTRAEAAFSEFYDIRIRPDTKRVVSAFFRKLVGTIDIPNHFFQMFLRILFEKLLLKHEAIPKKDEEGASTAFRPNIKEQNALRYVAGYMVFKLPRKILFKREREQMEVVLKTMKEGALKESRLNYTKEWVEAQSRGGLCMVNDKTFLFFQKLEEIVRKEFPTDTQVMKNKDLREKASHAALQDRMILDKWTTLTAQSDLSEHASLVMLQLIVDFYIQIRLFSFAKNIVERCKIKAKSTKKKSKGLRGAMKASASTNSTSQS